MQAASEGGQRLPTFPHLFSADLKLDGSQWEERSAEDSYYLEADALVSVRKLRARVLVGN